MDWKNFKLAVDRLSDGKEYLIFGRIMRDKDVVFYLPFEPTISDFSVILQKFRENHSITDKFNFKIFIQPVRYELNGNS